MFSITLKRSIAALGVVAGLLAAAGPASAQLPPTATGVTASGNDALAKDVFPVAASRQESRPRWPCWTRVCSSTSG